MLFFSLINGFLHTSTDEILGELGKSAAQDTHPTIEASQIDSWYCQIELIKETLSSIPDLEEDAGVLLEYFIPRRAKRIDTIILTHDLIFVLEFKIRNITETSYYNRSDIE